MKELAGRKWGVNNAILKKVYIGRTQPVLEYGALAWVPTAKSNFKLGKIKNQTLQIITGAMRSMPILTMENITAFQSLEDH